MLFRRRNPPSLGEQIRIALWPRRSWSRSLRYVLHRIWRLSGSPHRIAIGSAAGVFAAFTPLVGFQFLIAAVLAWLLGGRIVASALASFTANPISYPFIWVSTYYAGNLLLGNTEQAGAADLAGRLSALREGFAGFSPAAVRAALANVWPVLKPMLVGSWMLGGLAGLISYVLVRRLVETSQARRRARLELRALQRVHALKAGSA